MPSKKQPRRFHVFVTQPLIDQSIGRDSSHCMIAESIRASVPGSQNIAVDLQTIRFTMPERGQRFTFLTPRVAQRNLLYLDQGQRDMLQPYEFSLYNGQVTQANPKKTARQRSAAQMAASHANIAKAQEGRQRARLVGQTGNVPDKIGGRTPPMGTVSDGHGGRVPFSRRRVFGLRALSL